MMDEGEIGTFLRPDAPETMRPCADQLAAERKTKPGKHRSQSGGGSRDITELAGMR